MAVAHAVNREPRSPPVCLGAHASYLQGVNNVLVPVVVIAALAVNVAIVAAMFIWAAKKDGEYDRAMQKRLGIRRRTRLGPE